MTITAKLFDGTTLNFPDGTDPVVIARVAKEQTAALRARPPIDRAANVAAMTARNQALAGVSPQDAAARAADQNAMSAQVVDQNSMPDTFGGVVKDAAGAVGAGLARGASELVGLPGTVFNGGMWLGQKLDSAMGGAAPEPPYAANPVSGEAIRGYASALTGGSTEYRGKTPVSRIGGTVAEFIGGGAGAKVGTVMGVASELAGQATEGTPAEPWARLVGARSKNNAAFKKRRRALRVCCAKPRGTSSDVRIYRFPGRPMAR